MGRSRDGVAHARLSNLCGADMIAPGYNSMGLAEVFDADPITAVDWLKLAERTLAQGDTATAHAMLALSYQLRAQELSRA